MSSLHIGRLLVGPPGQWYEPLGDPVAAQGGAVVPGQRTAPQAQATVATWAADGQTDTLAARLTLRRQLRSLMNNTPLKLQAFLYVVYADDSEQNGWWVPDQATLQDLSGATGLATGLWQLSQTSWYLVGHPRTHREARSVWMKDLRTGLYARDTLGAIYSKDFSALSALALSILPPGAASAMLTVTGQIIPLTTLPAGRDGGACLLCTGLSDLQVASYDRPESSLNLGDVIAYDRRGQITAPSSGPDTSWQEVYGPDWPWNWQTAGQPHDAPVLDNGLVRVRYDASVGDPGLRIDAWTGSAYVEQGKVTFYRVGASYLDTWISAALREWTPERAVVQLVLASTADTASRERIYITVQRGRPGVTIEYYPAPTSAGAQTDGEIIYTFAGTDSNDTILFEPATSQPAASTEQVWSTASSNWTSASGTFSNTTANFLSVLRSIGGATTVGPFQVNLTVLQEGLAFAGASDPSGYGTMQNAIRVSGSGGKGWAQMSVDLVATQADQVQGTTASWTASQSSQYRVVGLSGTTWTDYGEYTGTAIATGSSSRVEAFLTQDRTRNGASYGGCRDRGQAALNDSRALGAVVTRN